MKSVLNVGGGNKAIPLPEVYQGWQHVLMDIDERGGPDVVGDARDLMSFPASIYDSVYCSHNLEHYFLHDVAKVLAGFAHVLKADGFVCIRVPDLKEVMRLVVENDLDLTDELYQSQLGQITVLDVIYGFGKEIEHSGHDFYAHKTGFSEKSMLATLNNSGFPWAFSGVGNLEILAYGFKTQPSPDMAKLLGLPEMG